MLYPSVNEIRKKTDSRYSLVILAAKRARDLIDGKPALVDIDNERPVSIAAYEIADDLITYRRPEENPALEASEEAVEEAEVSEEAMEEAPEIVEVEE